MLGYFVLASSACPCCATPSKQNIAKTPHRIVEVACRFTRFSPVAGPKPQTRVPHPSRVLCERVGNLTLILTGVSRPLLVSPEWNHPPHPHIPQIQSSPSHHPQHHRHRKRRIADPQRRDRRPTQQPSQQNRSQHRRPRNQVNHHTGQFNNPDRHHEAFGKTGANRSLHHRTGLNQFHHGSQEHHQNRHRTHNSPRP